MKFNASLILVMSISQLKLFLIDLIYLAKQAIVGATQFILETCFIKLPLRMLMLILDLLLLLEAYQVSFELYFQLDLQLLLVAFILLAMLYIHSEIQKSRVIITSAALISAHQTSLRLKLEPSSLTFQESFEMSLIKWLLPLYHCH